MSQHDMNVANALFGNLRTDLNSALAALISNSSGASEPATMFAYQFWADTTSGKLKIRNAANSSWVEVGALASTNLGLALAAGAASQTFSVGTAAAPEHAMRYEQYRTRQLLVDAATGTGSPGNTSENDLKSTTIPAGLLSSNGDMIHFVCAYRTAANATTKKLRIYFGTTQLCSTGDVALNNVNIALEGWIIRTGATSQVAYIKVLATADGATLAATPNGMVEFSSSAETLANALTLKTTATLGAGAALNDVIQEYLYYEHIKI